METGIKKIYKKNQIFHKNNINIKLINLNKESSIYRKRKINTLNKSQS